MADNRYGDPRGRNEWRERESSIFSNDDRRWSRDQGRDDDRGFLERAGDEVRSWFGDEEAERRRERDIRHDEEMIRGRERDYGQSSFASDFGRRSRDERPEDDDRFRERAFRQEPARFSEPVRGTGRSDARRGGSGERAFGGRAGFVGRSQWDENYLRWRDREIARLDQEYDEYCRECDRQFGQDFQSWRSSRLTEGGSADAQFGGTSRAQRAGTEKGGGSSGRLDAGTTGSATTGEQVIAGTGADTSGASSETVSSRGRGRTNG